MIDERVATAIASMLAVTLTYSMARARRLERLHQSRAARLEREAAHARLRTALAYLEPHFLFNTLNAIAALIPVNPTVAERMLVQFARLLRLALDDRSRTAVSLRAELHALDLYLSIQQMRYGDRLSVRREIDATALNAMVPALILQPLLENAIVHGLAPRGGLGQVEIVVERSNGRVNVSVIDDGVGLPTHPVWGDGLATTRARLATMFPGANELELTPRFPCGARATVSFAFAAATPADVAATDHAQDSP
jgi:two-component system LytT family sensor kinase